MKYGVNVVKGDLTWTLETFSRRKMFRNSARIMSSGGTKNPVVLSRRCLISTDAFGPLILMMDLPDGESFRDIWVKIRIWVRFECTSSRMTFSTDVT